MGVRLDPLLNPLEASIKDSTLYVYLLDEVVVQCPLKVPAGLVMERQLRHFDTPEDRLIAYLQNDEYILIIRYDGTCDLLTRDYVFLARSHMATKDILCNRIEVNQSCVVKSDDRSEICSYTKIGDYGFISCRPLMLNIYLKPSEENNILMLILEKCTSINSIILDDRGSGCTEFYADDGINVSKVLKDCVITKATHALGGDL